MLLSLDVGTSGCKAVIFNRKGSRIASSKEDYSPQMLKPGWIEINPNLIWTCVNTTIKKISSREVRAIAVTGFGDGVTPISKNGKPLYNIMSALDLRAAEQTYKLQKKVGLKEIFMITGQHLHPMHIINKINWLHDNRPDLYNKTSKFLQVADFINYKLTGEFVTDLTLASKTGLFDVNRKRWSDILSETAGISQDYLPRVKRPGEVIREIESKIANKLGLSKNTQVVLGGHDSACAAFGAGVIKRGVGVDVAGTWEILRVADDKPLLNEKMFNLKITSYCHVAEDKYVMGGAYISGALIDWYINIIGEQRSKDHIKKLIRKLPQTPSTIFILPHFAGSGTPNWDPNSRGAILGLHLGVNQIEVFKALLESLAFELTVNINCLEEAGLKVNLIRAAGGGADELLIQLKANITGRMFQSLKEPEVSSLGAAMLAGLGIKEYSSPTDAVQTSVKVKSKFDPQHKINRLYSSKLKLFSRIYPLLKDFNKEISNLQMNI